MKITFYFDITCPWTWVTSRWLTEVALERNFKIEWLSLSNSLVKGEVDSAAKAVKAPIAHRMQRIVEAVRKDHDNNTIGNIYASFGRHWHIENMQTEKAMELALRENGLDVQFYMNAGNNIAWDAVLRGSSGDAIEVGGKDTSAPLIVFNALGTQKAFYGPILSSMPDRADGLKLWDNLTWLLALPNFYQYKRPRDDIKPDIASTHNSLIYV